MSVIPAGFGSAAGDYTIDGSLRFRQSAGAYLTRSQSTSNQTTWTWSAWVKLGYLNNDQWVFGGYNATNNFTGITINLNTGIQIYQKNSNTTLYLVREDPIRRDYSSWYHFIIAYDSTQATSTDRIRFYVNGEQITTFASATWPDLNRNTWLNYNAASANIGRGLTTGNGQFDGYQTEINFIDGQALTADDFGEFDEDTGVWKPKEYQGTYGTNGFYLPTTATTQAEGFNTVLYTGTGSTQTIGDVGFNPDLVWIKIRDSATRHILVDSVRGSLVELYSNLTNAESLEASCPAIRDDGFQIQNGRWGNNGATYVGWCWDAGANQPSTGHSSILYHGSGGNPRQFTGFGFSPDLVWIKNRDGTAQNHMLFDSVRGPELRLQSDNFTSELDQSGSLISFDSDGFSFGTSAGNINNSATNYVAWGWDAGDGDPVSNTDGTINSTVKASDATGFSIVSYTGDGGVDSVGHGLSTAPDVVILKDRDNAAYIWNVYHKDLTSGHYLRLETTAASALNATIFGDGTSGVAPDSTKFYIGGNASVNTSGDRYIAYCFSEVSGVSKFGSYTGTGATGKVITTGFRPGFLMIKRTDSANSWTIIDATRNPFNIADSILWADLSDAEASGGATTSVNFTDTGFELNGAGGSINASGGTYIYMAFKGSHSDYVSPLNTDGDIDSRVKANTEKGFSIVSWEGDGVDGSTVGHGLTSTPETVIVKDRDNANNWAVYHKDLTSVNYSLVLNSTAAEVNYGSSFISPSASTLTLANGTQLNGSGRGYIAYCWHSVSGYSDFGTYTGTGSTGNSITGLGFQPAWLMVKRTDTTSNWVLIDNTRHPEYETNKQLYPNLDVAEGTSSVSVGFDSDGFTINNTVGNWNASGGTYIYMAFADTRDAQFNFDASGNKNNWTPNNINSNASSETSYDIMNDVPTLNDENTANYPTLNPLQDAATLSNGNLKLTGISTYCGRKATMAIPSTGKWYWETEVTAQYTAAGYWFIVGMCTNSLSLAAYSQSNADSVAYGDRNDGRAITNGTSIVTQSSAIDFSTGDVLQCAYDADTGKFWFGKNNAWWNSSAGTTGDPANGTNQTLTAADKEWFPYVQVNATNNVADINFGQRPFAYTPPTGFLPLNTYNLPDSTIEDGSQHFNTSLYTGTGSTGHAITGVGFQPDIVWIKSRSQVASHGLHDSLRVIGSAEEILYPNLTNDGNTGGAFLSSFDSDGFTVNNNNSGNGSGQSYVGWTWKAGGSGTSNSAGTNGATVASVYSANQTAGISIVTYTGNRTTDQGETGTPDTIYHGLGKKPDMVITKNRTTQTYPNWNVWHVGYQPDTTHLNHQLWLHLTNAANNAGWQRTDQGFTANLFCPARYAYDNVNGVDYVAYCFTSIEGFSSFGGYVGNGSSDGPFIYTGFRPAWVLLKRADAAASWYLHDSVRDTYNQTTKSLYPNLNSAEDTGYLNLDLTSNGFKLRTTTSNNVSGGTYIYAAFAENPFKNSLAR